MRTSIHIAAWALRFLMLFLTERQELHAQTSGYPFDISGYNFVQYDSNKVRFMGSPSHFEQLFDKMEKLLLEGKGQINVAYFGGSHIQADIISGQIRNRLQALYGGQDAGRGMLFPFRLVPTNTPYGYHFDYSGEWETCRNTEKNKICELGMTGIMAMTKDSLSSLTLRFEPENPYHYSFNRIRVYHQVDSFSFAIRLDTGQVDSNGLKRIKSIKSVPEEDYTEIELYQETDSIQLFFVQEDSSQTGFMLFGLLPINDYPGIVFHSLGINGAATSSFLNCQRLERQLKSIKPDLVIFGLGINDAYGRRFSVENYEQNYDALVQHVYAANPNAAVIFATNNDSYLYRRYVNRNGLLVQKSMYRLAERNDAAVWDMFEIMGGLNSIQLWKKHGLAKRDRIHFTREGYILLGDLFTDALLSAFGDYLHKGVVETSIIEGLSKK